MKKKMSFFLVLVLVLILISSSSSVLVVLLSPKRFREEVAGVEVARTAAMVENKRCCVSASEIRPDAGFGREARKLLSVIPKDSSVSLTQAGVGGRAGRSLEEERNYRAVVSNGTRKVAIATLPASLLLCCALLCPCFWSKKKELSEQPVLELTRKDYVSSSFDGSSNSERTFGGHRRPPPSPLRVPPSPPKFSMSPRLSRAESIHLDINQIIKATQNFSHSHEIGGGGFGTVYKAELPDGQVVAIKRARKDHFQASKSEFSSEVELLAKIEHRNLVRLLGYVNNGIERIIISEYIPNGTLREHLDGQHGKILDFNQRLEIAIDVAHALTYLHLYAEKPIIHRDVKSSNILLTESFKAKVSDFGFARIGATDEDQSHVLTKVRGTAGYLDPEYLRTHQLTPKSDVFSFGILLLEILSGRRPVESKRGFEERITVRWVRHRIIKSFHQTFALSKTFLSSNLFPIFAFQTFLVMAWIIKHYAHLVQAFKKYTQGRARDILDPLLEEVVHGEVLMRIFGLAFECAAPTRVDRPTMKQVGETLWEVRREYSRNIRRE